MAETVTDPKREELIAEFDRLEQLRVARAMSAVEFLKVPAYERAVRALAERVGVASEGGL